jgi:Holliday junction resolvase RusA-like endonuclease
MKGFVVNGRTVVTADNKKTRPWRQDVAAAAEKATDENGVRRRYLGDTPIVVDVAFYMPRPKGHYGTGRNAGQIKASAPAFPTVKPDVDKLARAVLDALKTAGIYRDDAQVVDMYPRKRYAMSGSAGARVHVWAKQAEHS